MIHNNKDIPRLLRDEHVWVNLAAILRNMGFDVIHTIEVNLNGRSDSDVLTFASQEGRALLTYNAKDFALLAKEWSKLDKEHSGIIISNQLPQGELLRLTEALLKKLPAGELENTVRFLQDYK